MFSTDLSTISLAVAVLAALFLCVFALIRAARAEKYAFDAVSHMEQNNAKSLSLRRMAEVEATLTDLLDSYDSLLRSHKRLRARIGMREVRAKRKNAENGVDLDAKPVSDAEKAEYKANLRSQLRAEGRLK